MDLLKHGDDGHRVHGSDQAAKEQVLQQADVQLTYAWGEGPGCGQTSSEEHTYHCRDVSEGPADSPMAPPKSQPHSDSPRLAAFQQVPMTA